MDSTWGRLLTDPMSLLWGMIIRPPRSRYNTKDLGHRVFTIPGCGRKFERVDFQVFSDRGHQLECSHFVPENMALGERLPCVVYLHGSCSSRLEALDTLRELLPRGLTVCCLDLSGSGLSEGEYVSLGHFEERDLAALLKHLRASGSVSSIGLWGRSMGAVTGALRASQDNSLAACVLDSPFGDLTTVARELVQRTRWSIPEFMVDMALEKVRAEVKARASFDIQELRPVLHAPRARVPALFVVAKQDNFVLPHHTFDMHKAWGCEDRRVVTVGGGHDSLRPNKFMQFAGDFLQKRLLLAAGQPIPEHLVREEIGQPAQAKTTTWREASKVVAKRLGGC